jgi:hypothetical protein
VDIPGGYNETGFHEIAPLSTSESTSGGITFASQSQDQGNVLAGLHQTFEKPEHISTDASSNFEMIMWSWGRFVMPITITTMDGNEYEYMYPFTFRAQLEDAQRSGYRFIDATNAWNVIGGY